MYKLIFVFILSFFFTEVFSQGFVLSTDGFKGKDGENYVIIEVNGVNAIDLINRVDNIIKTKCKSENIKTEILDNKILISDLIKGYTKTDKMAGSAYLFDLSYKFTIDFKDGKIKINTPIFNIGSQNKFYSSNNHFTLSMDIIGKNDVWSNDAKKFFIYNENGKLIEKSTKEKLETTFNSLIDLISKNIVEKNDDW